MLRKTIIITGATSGIGRAAAWKLLRQGHHIVVLARSRERAERTRAELLQQAECTHVADPTLDMIDCDLASLHSVRTAASEILERYARIDVLINNAGTYAFLRKETRDGFELAFGVNHVGHFFLTQLLLERIQQSAPARIVVLSSSAHRIGKIWFDDIHLQRNFRGMRAYGQSKLANVLFTRELARRLDSADVTVNALHPGTVATAFMSRRRDGLTILRGTVQSIFRLFLRSAQKGAETVVYLATDPEVAGMTGLYFYDKRPMEPSDRALNDDDAKRLWEYTETLIGSAGHAV